MTHKNYSGLTAAFLALMLLVICAVCLWLVAAGTNTGDSAMGAAVVLTILLAVLGLQLLVFVPAHALALRRAKRRWGRPSATWVAASLAPVILTFGWLLVSGAPSRSESAEEATEIRLEPPPG